MIYATSNSFFKVWDVQAKENVVTINMSTSRKDKKTGEYVNSSWNYVSFVGKCKEKAEKLNRGDKITNLEFGLDREPYYKDNEKLYPKQPRITVFDFTVVASNGRSGYEPPEEPDDSELPF